ncbi:MAG: hypothetical protein ACLGHX_09585 [Acidimicrobiia bacterium]
MISLAHGFYLDEILWFVVPVGLSLFVLRWAERKAKARAVAEETDPAAQVEEDRPAD